MISLKDKLQSLQATPISESTTELPTQAQSIIQRTFLWMGIITFIVFAVGYYVVSLIKTGTISPSQYTVLFWVSALGGLGLVFAISFFWEKMNYITLAVLAILFSVLEWIGLAGVLAVYNAASVINAFAGAGILFLLMALYGYFTKSDLTKLGTILLIGLIAIIILTLLNVFLIKSGTFSLVLSIIGLLIFLWLTAWNIQTLKLAATNWDKRLEIVFGVSLYLDFINIFLYLLELYWKSQE